MPEGLDERGQTAWKAIVEILRKGRATNTGGGTAFRAPAEWKARGEKYGGESKLVVVYDGGNHRPYFTMDEERYDLIEKVQEALKAHGMHFEEATSWYGAVYTS